MNETRTEIISESLLMVKRSLHAKNLNLYRHVLLTADLAQSIVESSKIDFGLSPVQAYIAGILHDVGKIFVYDDILEKKTGLSPQEWEVMHRHPVWGCEFVQKSVFEEYGDLIMGHHEVPDGRGYPLGIAGAALDNGVRLIAVADRTAALLEDRPYRRRISHFGIQCHAIHEIVGIYFHDLHMKKIEETIQLFSRDWIENSLWHDSRFCASPAFGIVESCSTAVIKAVAAC